MDDREWFKVELPNGAPASSTEFTSRDLAAAAARNLITSIDEGLVVVKYTRREVRAFDRIVSITETDLAP